MNSRALILCFENFGKILDRILGFFEFRLTDISEIGFQIFSTYRLIHALFRLMKFTNQTLFSTKPTTLYPMVKSDGDLYGCNGHDFIFASYHYSKIEDFREQFVTSISNLPPIYLSVSNTSLTFVIN